MTNDGLRHFVSRPKKKGNTLGVRIENSLDVIKHRTGLQIFVIMTPCGRNLGVETCRSWYHSVHTLDDVFIVRGAGRSGIESRWGSRFSAPVQIGPVAHPGSYKMGTGFFPGVKRQGCGVDHPLPSSAEVIERVELYFYSSGSSWPVLGWSLTLPLFLCLPSSLSLSLYIYIYRVFHDFRANCRRWFPMPLWSKKLI